MLETFKIAHWAKLITRHTLGFPQFSSRYLANSIEPASSEPAELAQYAQLTGGGRLGRCRFLYLLGSSLLLLKTFILPSYVLSTFDTHEMSAKVRESRTTEGQRLFSFECLTTNCSRLSLDAAPPPAPMTTETENQQRGRPESELLGADLFRLPVYTLCRPQQSRLSDPLQYLDMRGCFMESILLTFIAICGLVSPIIQALWPTSSLFLMFLVAPNVTRRVVFERAKRLAGELAESYENQRHCLQMRRFELTRLCQPSREQQRRLSDLEADPRLSTTGQTTYQVKPSRPACQQTQAAAAAAAAAADATSDSFAWDCVTSTRSVWWRYKINQLFNLMSTILVVHSWDSIILGSLIIISQVMTKDDELASIADQVERMNCSIWYNTQTGSSGPGAPVELANVISLAKDLPMINQLLGHLAVATCFALFCSYYFGTIAELFNWLNEIRLQSEICLEFTREFSWRLRRRQTRRTRANWATMIPEASGLKMEMEGRLAGGRAEAKFEMQPIRLLHKRLTRIYLCLPVQHRMGLKETSTTRSELQFKLAVEQFVTESASCVKWAPADHEHSLELLLDMWRKLYISYRLFLDHLLLEAPCVGLMVVLMNIYNYVNLAMGVIYIRSFKGFVFGPIIFVAIGFCISICFTFFPANFHAKAKRLQPIIWSMLAETHASGLHNSHVEHLRLLWLKLVLLLDRDSKGLALKAFNIRMNYVNIISVMASNATILVVALRV